MKRIYFLLVLFLANLSLLSCTAESLSEIINEPMDIYATGNESQTKEHGEDLPPSGGN